MKKEEGRTLESKRGRTRKNEFSSFERKTRLQNAHTLLSHVHLRHLAHEQSRGARRRRVVRRERSSNLRISIVEFLVLSFADSIPHPHIHNNRQSQCTESVSRPNESSCVIRPSIVINGKRGKLANSFLSSDHKPPRNPFNTTTTSESPLSGTRG